MLPRLPWWILGVQMPVVLSWLSERRLLQQADWRLWLHAGLHRRLLSEQWVSTEVWYKKNKGISVVILGLVLTIDCLLRWTTWLLPKSEAKASGLAPDGWLQYNISPASSFLMESDRGPILRSHHMRFSQRWLLSFYWFTQLFTSECFK